ncbi:cytoChrome c' [Roseibium sp. TrichSKD4]|uniref:c-type cytochrome n=1 Tax=Roseibium sp. TrichSKD4 TaxID=744980 RepID=UPI0001E571DD|nr:cytochrome c [Roseibium sp. TrichSKD4]EFO29030.1 cytoChrome c' [Roseibium sp. TrichSKD4]
MRFLKYGIAVAALAAASLSLNAAAASDDPVADRKAVMQSVGAAAGLGGGMLKGQIEYTPAAGKAAISTMNAAAHTFGGLFPDGSDMADNSTAAPAIWDDRAGFDAELAKFAAATGAAAKASGKEGPADLDAFKAVFGPVLGTCKSCHEGFRVK